MKRLPLPALVIGLALVAAAAAADATGKWTWTIMVQNNEIMQTLDAKQDGEKLTGTVSRGDQKTEIKEGKVKGTEISFIVVRERNGQEFKSVYTGKLDGDMIKGTITTNFGGQERKIDWVAKRSK